MTEAVAFAPATSGNAAVGFDVLGFAAGVIGDRVTVRRGAKGVRVVRAVDLPTDPTKNTASVALLAMLAELGPDFGFDVELDKGIPVGSGLGGSAASAVGAVVAANALLETPRPAEDLFRWALAGEAVASGHAHPDNVAPCLYGGLTLTTGHTVQVLPAPALWVSLVHPALRVDTKMAREILPTEVPLTTAVAQMGHLAAFVDACHRRDALTAAAHCVDLLVEPHRTQLVPGFQDARQSAELAGALAFSLSGSGPTVFALSLDESTASSVTSAMSDAFARRGIEANGWVCQFGTSAARIL